MAQKQNTKGERIAWMTRTSDIVGSFHNESPEACTTLIRRKIQERCGNTQELMSAIRRLKTGNTGHVTPNEFRLTLLKFGITVPQHQLEQIFNLFDSDRSGTIDFDEFAMWIMNSEFHPISKNQSLESQVTPEARLQKRLRKCFTDHAKELSTLKNQIDFLGLLSFVHDKNIPLIDSEIRRIFTLLDRSNTGLIDTNKLRSFAMENSVSTPLPSLPREPVKPNLQQAIMKLCGNQSPQVLLSCFQQYNSDSKINFQEFLRCLQLQNLGSVSSSSSSSSPPQDAYDLFLALNGTENGVCHLRGLFDSIPPLRPSNNQSNNSSHRHLQPLNPYKVSSHHSFMTYGKANRSIRDAMRQNHEKILSACCAADVNQTGHLSPHTLWKLINDEIMPMKYEDLRLMLRKTPSNASGDYNYSQFLAPFHPSNISKSESTPQPSPSSSSSPSLHKSQSLSNISNIDENNSKQILKEWENAFRACKSIDSEQCGFISQKKFLTTLSQNLKIRISRDEIQQIIRNYRIGNDFDYRSFFRLKLNNALNETTLMSTADSVFQILPGNISRPVGPSHPWDFNYYQGTTPPLSSASSRGESFQQSQQHSQHLPMESNNQTNGAISPYWKRACVEPKRLPLPSSSSSSSSSLLTSIQFQYPNQSSSNTSSFPSSSSSPSSSANPTLLPLLKRLSSHPQYRSLLENFKRNSLPSRVGYISNKFFLSSLQAIHFPLKKSEFNLLLKEFRAIGLPDTFHFQKMIEMING